jgi:hypothetical protein
MQKGLKKGIYLYLRDDALHQLRQAAKNHQGTLAAEATRILEETLRPDHVCDNAPSDAAGTDKCNANGVYLDLSEELLARLRPLAERNYRSLAGEAANVLETVLSFTEQAASKPKSMLKSKKKPRLSKPAVQPIKSTVGSTIDESDRPCQRGS